MPISLLATYAASTASLTDSSDATYLEDAQVNLLPGVFIEDQPSELSSGFTGTPVDGEIAYLEIRARARQLTTGGGTVGSDCIRWRLGPYSAEAGQTFASSFGWLSSGPIAARPGGGLWTWSDLSSLTAGVAALFGIPPFGSCSLQLAELAVDVYGSGQIELAETAVVPAGNLEVAAAAGGFEAEAGVGGIQAAVELGGFELELCPVGAMTVTVGASELTGGEHNT